ncbi:MAG: response regulator [Acetobacteraceae bacterium]|nr:response regulator [Acetobacteraceae bacterium]
MAGRVGGPPSPSRFVKPAVLATVFCALALGAAAAGFGYRLYVSIGQLRAGVEEANAIIDATGSYVDALRDAETGQRGYLLTMRPSYLEPFWTSGAVYERAGARLEELTRGSPALEADVAALRSVGQQKMTELTDTVQRAMRGGQQAALPQVLTDFGKVAMESVRQHASHINNTVLAARAARTAALVQDEQDVLYGILLASFGGLSLLGAVSLMLLFGRSRLVETQGALQLQSERLRGIVDHIPEGVAVFDSTDRLLMSNPAFGPMAGIPPEYCRPGRSFADVASAARDWEPPLRPDSRPGPAPQTSEARRGEHVLQIWRSPMPDGGQMLGVSDITRRVQAEAIARQAQKIESIGQLTGGVAHDFNNLLQVVSANLELVERRLEAGNALHARLAAAQAAVERGARLTRHLLAFARRQPLAPESTDPARLLRGMEDMLRRTLGHDIPLEFVHGGGLWPVRVDPHQLENAVLNLCINARDAIRERDGERGGRITIEATNANLDAIYAAANPDAPAGQYVLIAISDTGIGMAADQIARAVEPFYTTKAEGKGTGLGLSMVYGFVKQSGGHFKIYSEPGHGTTVKLYLPRSHAMPAMDYAPAVPEAAPGDGELVLVVEDETAVRTAAIEAIGGLGYRTIAAENAADALALIDGGYRPDLLFTDVVMPGEPSARELASRASARLPQLAVVFTSGYTANAVVHNGQVDPDVQLVSKPWRIEELAQELRTALNRRRDRLHSPAPLRVLLVEDDALIRKTTADLLADMGCEVMSAATGQAAIDALQTGADLLIADFQLPDMDGCRLAALARQLQPRIAVIIASGCAEKATGGHSFDEPGPPPVWLAKPYSGQSLAAALEKARTGTA